VHDDAQIRSWGATRTDRARTGAATRRRDAPGPGRARRSFLAQRRVRKLSDQRGLPIGGLAVADLAAVLAALGGAFAVRAVIGSSMGPLRAVDHAVVLVVAPLAFVGAFSHAGLYSSHHTAYRAEEVRRTLRATAMAVLVLALVAYATQGAVSRSWLLLLFVLAAVAVVAERAVARRVIARARRRGRLLRPVVVVGAGPEAAILETTVAADPTLGYQVVGHLDPADLDVGRGPLAAAEDIVAAGYRAGAAAVMVAPGALDAETCRCLARLLASDHVDLELPLSLCDVASERIAVRPLGRFTVAAVQPVRRHGWRAAVKRGFDIAVSGSVLVLVAPALAVAMVAIRLTSPGPALFRQARVGQGGRLFEVLKLRTMVEDAEARLVELRELNEADGPLFKIRDDPRVTRVGPFLRRTSIDELPQLWNVLRGDMSVVGPRPALPSELAAWADELHERLRVRPGMTGMWQVSGRANAPWDEYQRLDLYYVDNWSLAVNLGIVMRTIPVVLGRRDAS
jgi:exopolysaccharide biosynthesis polyprenyl glycosylphosphotransferase